MFINCRRAIKNRSSIPDRRVDLSSAWGYTQKERRLSFTDRRQADRRSNQCMRDNNLDRMRRGG